jgi:alcohol dehydrogenase (NADP+)
MATEYKFFGWLGKDKDSVDGKMVWEEYTPKPWTEDDVDIKVCSLYFNVYIVK